MRGSRVVGFLVVLGISAVAGASWGLSITSSVAQSGAEGPGLVHQYTLQDWDFTGQDYLSLVSIDSISITLTMFDGDSGPGDFDVGDLTLGLDDIDTGLVLDGFGSDVTVTLGFGGVPGNAGDVLLALRADGMLSGQVFDADAADGLTAPHSNIIGFPGGEVTTITITGASVPEPSTILLLGTGLVGAAGVGRSSWRRSS